jgi:flavin-dependent dehydrogenase
LQHEEKLSQADVTVFGGGLAGMAASIHLVRAGMDVQCIDNPADKWPVGESLDWSAPRLLADLGLPMEMLVQQGFGTWKRHVSVQMPDGRAADYVPGEWLGRPPFNLELRTLHVDRPRLNAAIRDIALREGVRFLEDRVVGVDTNGRRITTARTAADLTLRSRWFIDASGGSTRLLPRAFGLPDTTYGPVKVAMWSYRRVSETVPGTTLHFEGERAGYLRWVWEVPIHSDTVSLGFVVPGETVKTMRASGKSVADIFAAQLEGIQRLRECAEVVASPAPHVTSFRCRVHKRVFGPNWLVVGEAAAMVDPMTSNGVTAALRHAAEASAILIGAGSRRTLPWLPCALYSRRMQDLARLLNCGIEKLIYERTIRCRFGVKVAGEVYTIPAWSINTLYARFRPRGIAGSLTFCLALACLRAAANVLAAACGEGQSAVESPG